MGRVQRTRCPAMFSAKTDRVIKRDAEQPRIKRRVTSKRLEFWERQNERFLRDVSRVDPSVEGAVRGARGADFSLRTRHLARPTARVHPFGPHHQPGGAPKDTRLDRTVLEQCAEGSTKRMTSIAWFWRSESMGRHGEQRGRSSFSDPCVSVRQFLVAAGAKCPMSKAIVSAAGGELRDHVLRRRPRKVPAVLNLE